MEPPSPKPDRGEAPNIRPLSRNASRIFVVVMIVLAIVISFLAVMYLTNMAREHQQEQRGVEQPTPAEIQNP